MQNSFIDWFFRSRFWWSVLSKHRTHFWSCSLWCRGELKVVTEISARDYVASLTSFKKVFVRKKILA